MARERAKAVGCRSGTDRPRNKRWIALMSMGLLLAMEVASTSIRDDLVITGFCGNARCLSRSQQGMRAEKPSKDESTQMATTQQVDLLEAMSDDDAKKEAIVSRIPRSIEQDDGTQEMVEQATKTLGVLALLALPIVAFGLKAFFEPINDYLDTKTSYAEYCGSPAYAYKRMFAPDSGCIDTSAPRP
mmetsp:Transcript_56493/g.132509  ORF Transcript_56493/g.132509 Transcript_56493/m.132509 type:complete len:187 (-) Transcript_56493:37-597(-)